MESIKQTEKVKAVLKLNANNEEVIEIILDEQAFQINFTKEDQSELRDFFKFCIEKLLKEPFELEYSQDSSIDNQLIIKVAKEYINDLNTEIKQCLEDIVNNTDESEGTEGTT